MLQGFSDKPKSSGYAIYRTWFSAKEQGIDKDPLTKHFFVKGGSFHGWVGEWYWMWSARSLFLILEFEQERTSICSQ